MRKYLYILTIAVLLSACAKGAVEAKLPLDNKQVQTVKPIVHTTARAKSINFTHTVQSERAVVGEPYVIDISFLGKPDSDMTTHYETTPSLALNSTPTHQLAFDVSGKSQSQQITVTPRSEGIHFITIYRAGEATLKPAAIKVIAGNKPEKDYMRTEGELVEDSDGMQVIEIPADEG